MCVHSYEGGGHHEHLGLIVNIDEYTAVENNNLHIPPNPGATASLVDNATAAQISAVNRVCIEALCIYHEYKECFHALKKHMITVIKDHYLNALSDETVSYAVVTGIQLVTHIMTNYGMISPMEIAHKYERLMVFQQNQDASVLFTIGGSKSYCARIIINIEYTLMFSTGLFRNACHQWQALAQHDKTWAMFKTYFSAAQREYCLVYQTTQQVGFHSANTIMEDLHEDFLQGTAEAVAVLATATAADRGMVETLMATNDKLTAQLEISQELVAALKKMKMTWQGNLPAKTTDSNSYWWSRGYQVHENHNSATCRNRKEGHKKTAVKDKTMGVAPWGKA
jgi:hypothetical protein